MNTLVQVWLLILTVVGAVTVTTKTVDGIIWVIRRLSQRRIEQLRRRLARIPTPGPSSSDT